MKKTLFVLFFLAFFVSCSSNSSSNKLRNTISPNDPEFDPDPDKVGAQLSDLGEQELLELAEAAYEKQLFSVSRDNWSKLRDTYPGSPYATLAELKIADCYFFTDDYTAAITSYEEFLKLHPAHEAIAYVIYQIGNAYKAQYSGTAHDQGPLHTALKYYKRILANYPNSEFAKSSVEKIKECNNNLAAHEALVARFYEKQKKPVASNERLKYISEEFAQSNPAKWARNKLNLPNSEGKDAKEEASKEAANTPEESPNTEADVTAETSETSEEAVKEIPKIVTKITTTKEIAKEEIAPINFSLQPTAVSCDRTDNATIVTFYFNDEIKIINSNNKEVRGNEKLIIALKNNQNNIDQNYFLKLSQQELTLELNCSEKNFSFSAKKLFDKKNIHLQYAEFNFEFDGKETSFFTLDRTSRLIAVIYN